MAIKKIIYGINELQPTVDELYSNGIVRGKDIGFDCLRDLYTVKPACTTYIMGSPTSGKTEFWFEILLNLSEFYGWKHVIYTPETGTKEEIVAELCSKYIRKPFYKNYSGYMSESEKYSALAWLSQYFYIIDPADKDLTIVEFYDEVEALEKKEKIHIDTTTIDPYNELKNEFKDRQDLYIESLLGLCRRNAMKHNRHNCIITHCADQKPMFTNGITWFPPPTAREYAGGQAWYRKGLAMIGAWRPPHQLSDDKGRPYEKNEVDIIIQKAKPKGIGEKGTAKLYFDWHKNRYYEKSLTGEIKFAEKFDPEKKVLKPEIQVDINFQHEPELTDENPF
jgi:hypothetical protein